MKIKDIRRSFLLNLSMIVFFITIVSSYSSAQGSEEKPKYAPGKEKHRNRTDEIGRKQGKWMFFNTFGDKISEIDFVNDKKEGVDRRFFGYDKVREETEFLGGVKDGAYTKYFFSGQVQLEGAYKDGKKDGKWTRYFEDGSIRQDGAYISGKKDGVWKSYNRKGNVVGQATYKNGVNLEELEARKKREEEAKKNAELKKDGKKSGAGIPLPKGAQPKKPADKPAEKKK